MSKRFYELIFIISLNKNTEEVKGDIHEVLNYYNIKVVDQESKETGIKKLAYPIKKQTSAYYYIIFVEMDSNCAQKINNDFRLNESILRYLAFFKDLEKIERRRKKMEEMISRRRVFERNSESVVKSERSERPLSSDKNITQEKEKENEKADFSGKESVKES